MEDPVAWIDAAARDQPRRMCLRASGRPDLSYADLRCAIARFAAALEARGVGAGDRVAAQVEKSPEAVFLYLACLATGAVFVPLNTAYTVHEIGYHLRDAQPRLLIVRPQEHTALASLAAECGVAAVETQGSAGEGTFPELAAGCTPRDRAAVAGGWDAPAAIVYTSGTTGRSKGAVLTRGNLASNASVLATAWRFTPADVLLHALPLFHVHGLFVAINTVLAAGAGLLLLPKYAAPEVLGLLPQATLYMGVPTHYTRLLQEPGLDREVTASIRLFVSGSAPLRAETHREFERRTGHIILERYGMTETLMNTSNPYEGRRAAGSVGLPLPGVGVRIADARGDGARIGMIEVNGPNVFAGYWGDPDKTRAEFTDDGWFKTGDLGRIDAEGYVHIVGRSKDLVITGGYNVYPREVESELDAVSGVLESAVFGVPHPDLGEGVAAAVVAAPGARLGEADLVAAVKTRLAGYKVPKRIVVVDELPRNALGKVQKNVLRARYARLFAGPSPGL